VNDYDWAAFEAAVDDIERRGSPPVPRRLGSARAGALAGAMLLGLQEVLEPPRDRVPVEAPAPQGRSRRPVRVVLDPVPSRSVAIVAVSPPP
jgi:hypothetical protein